MFMFTRIFTALVLSICVAGCASSGQSRLNPLTHEFADFPSAGLSQPAALPTANQNLFRANYVGFVARSADNPTYGMPGYTRDGGARFHKGVDILPVRSTLTGKKIRMEYSGHGHPFTRWESLKTPHDEVRAILDGRVVVANQEPRRSGYGKYVMIEHHWADGSPFVSMCAHLSRVDVSEGQMVSRGQRIGVMGQTSSEPGGRKYLSFIPHTHFEVGRVINWHYAGSDESDNLNPPNFSGNFDPRNIQPYHPLQFLLRYAQAPSPASGTPMPANTKPVAPPPARLAVTSP
ncbi:MAG: M23 family metallopeptidase [Verrucomicrobiae bacterium]|nr:M23 family metallopeptidase [Verrucomicrobiae bacterium]